MSSSQQRRPRGVLAPVVTPFRPDLSIDIDLLIAHCRHLLAEGCGLAVFGTNSEAASLAPAERMDALERLVSAGIPADRLMPGTGCCALADTVALTAHAHRLGVQSVLVLPPFFYKEASDAGLHAYFGGLIDKVAADDLRIYLYHIPQYTQVPITTELVRRLLDTHPRNVAGLKDSSGQWANTSEMLSRFAERGFDVFCASEVFLSATVKMGGAGCISATANVNPAGLSALYSVASTPQCAALQAEANKVRAVFQARPLIAAMKYFLSRKYRNGDWRRLRPPLDGMGDAEGALLLQHLGDIGFTA